MTKRNGSVTYSRAQIWALLRDYQRHALGARLTNPGDRLGSRPAPADEHPEAATSRLYADLDRALQSLPFEQMMVTWWYLAVGQSTWNRCRSNSDWRERVGDWWDLTAGQVNQLTQEAVDAIYAELNGLSQVDNMAVPALA